MKTKEQQAEEYAKQQKIKRTQGQSVAICIKNEDLQEDAFIAGYEAAQRWIPVEEEMPVFNKTEYPNGDYKVYFVKISTGGMSPIVRYGAAHLINDKRWSCEWDWNVVTHWRPIEYK
jgi:hypothetical protein